MHFTSKKCLSLLKGVVVIVCSQTACTCISGLASCYSTVKNMQCACAHPGAVLKWSEYLGIFGHSDKGCSGHVLIHVLSWDGQSVSGSWDILRKEGGMGCISDHPGTFQDGQSITRSQYTKGDGVGCICAGASAILEWSEYFGICVLVWYNTYSILRISAI